MADLVWSNDTCAIYCGDGPAGLAALVSAETIRADVSDGGAMMPEVANLTAGPASGMAIYASDFQESDEPRFWAKVDKSGDCWIWTAGKDRLGYGSFTIKYRQNKRATAYKAHRVAYALAYGAVDAGVCVLHTCDNPSCVNPDHLRLGTHGDNMRDMANKGRGCTCRQDGENNKYAKLTEEEVLRMRSLHERGLAQHELANIFRVSPGTVSDVVRRHTWKHI